MVAWGSQAVAINDVHSNWMKVDTTLTKLAGGGLDANFIRTSIHDEYDLMLFWHVRWSILRV